MQDNQESPGVAKSVKTGPVPDLLSPPGNTNACNRRLLSEHRFCVSDEFGFICMLEVGLDEGRVILIS